MANVKISALPAGTTPDRTEVVPAVQSAATVQFTLAQILGALLAADIPASAITDAKVSASAAIAESKLALASDAAAGTASRRTLGTGAAQACAGNDSRLSDTRTPTDGSVTDAKVSASAAIAKSKLAALDIVNADVNAAAAIAETKLSLASDAAAGTASRRTLGTGALQATAGNDSRLSDTRTPTAGSVVDASVSASAAIAESKLSLATDAAAGTGSRRTLGTGAAQAAAGDHAHSGTLVATDFTGAGDLLVGTGVSTYTRLAKGSALQIVRVNAAGTALEYAAEAGGTPDPGMAVFDRCAFR